MSQPNSITVDRLARLLGRPDTPLLIDVRVGDDVARDPRLIPGSLQRNTLDIASWRSEFVGDPRLSCANAAPN